MYLILFVQVLSLAQLALSFNCSIPPIYVDIHKRAVHDSEVFQYGAFIGLGTPAQNQSLWPSFEHNETTLAGLGFCTSDSPADCGTNTHGFFQPDLSKSWQDEPNYQPFDTGDNTSVSIEYGEDTMYLYTHYFEIDPATATTCHNFPSSILSNSTSPDLSFFGPAGRLGLGAYSTNLEQLYANNFISSRSFGLYLGTGYDRAGGDINGSLTYGGYDSGRMTGQVYNYTMALPITSPTQSPLQVHVSQISLDFNDGSGLRTLPLLNGSGFDAQISTSQYPLSLPHAVTSAFASALSATPANNSDNSLRLARPFNGNLTINLSSGLSVTFPPDWISNTSAHLTPISASPVTNPTNTSSNEPSILGSAFLTQVYLALNYDSTPPSFHLAQAVLKNGYVMPQSQCPNIAPVPYTQPPLNHFVAAGLVGAILGGLIGGCAITLLVWVCARRYCAKRRRAKQVRFAQESKVLELEEYREEVVKGGFTVVATPVTPGWPLSNEMAERQPLSPRHEHVIDGEVGRMRVTTVFDPPPRRSWTVGGEEGSGRKKGRGRR